MNPRLLVKHIIAGQFRNEFIIDLNGTPHINIDGGAILYAAGGLGLWKNRIGLLSIIGSNFPLQKITDLTKKGMDIRGIKRVDAELDMRRFYSNATSAERDEENPVSIFAAHGFQFPKELLDYSSTAAIRSGFSMNGYSGFIEEDIPADYLDAVSAHLCPLGITTHVQIPLMLRKGIIRIVTIQPHPSYMVASNWNLIPGLLKDVTAFMPDEDEIRSLFRGRSEDLWEMAESLAELGCEFLVIKRKSSGIFLFDSSTSSKYQIPEYPTRQVDPTGMRDAFAGGFTAGLDETHDPLSAAIYGIAASSLTGEGCGPFYCQSSLPGLAQARIDAIRKLVKKV